MRSSCGEVEPEKYLASGVGGVVTWDAVGGDDSLLEEGPMSGESDGRWRVVICGDTIVCTDGNHGMNDHASSLSVSIHHQSSPNLLKNTRSAPIFARAAIRISLSERSSAINASTFQPPCLSSPSGYRCRKHRCRYLCSCHTTSWTEVVKRSTDAKTR